MSNAMLNFTTQSGIKHQDTIRNHPQQNDGVEYINQILAEYITAMLDKSGLAMVSPLLHWSMSGIGAQLW